MTPLELFLTQEDGDWIRSPQVTAGHLSDAELFDPKRKWVKVVKDDLTKWDESKHDRKADGKFAPKGQGEAGGAKPATPQKTTPKQVSVIRYDGAPIEYAPGEKGQAVTLTFYDYTKELEALKKSTNPDDFETYKRRAKANDRASKLYGDHKISPQPGDDIPLSYGMANRMTSTKAVLDDAVTHGWTLHPSYKWVLVSPDKKYTLRTINKTGADYIDLLANRGEFEQHYMPGYETDKKTTTPKPSTKTDTKIPGKGYPTATEIVSVIKDKIKDINKEEDSVISQRNSMRDTYQLDYNHLVDKREDAIRELRKTKPDVWSEEWSKAYDKIWDEYSVTHKEINKKKTTEENEFLRQLQEIKKNKHKIIRQVLAPDNPATINHKLASKTTYRWRTADKDRFLKNIDNGLQDLMEFVDAETVSTKQALVRSTKSSRAFYMDSDTSVNLTKRADTDTVRHEFGHFIEHGNPEVAEACREFLLRRTGGQEALNMKKTYGGGYTKNEWCKPDKFMEPYVGKIYLMNNLTDQPPEDIDTTALLRSSEVLSMGINYYLNDPINFAEKDPEHFELIYDICHGKYRMKGNS